LIKIVDCGRSNTAMLFGVFCAGVIKPTQRPSARPDTFLSDLRSGAAPESVLLNIVWWYQIRLHHGTVSGRSHPPFSFEWQCDSPAVDDRSRMRYRLPSGVRHISSVRQRRTRQGIHERSGDEHSHDFTHDVDGS
jgi:hypothetical protein